MRTGMGAMYVVCCHALCGLPWGVAFAGRAHEVDMLIATVDGILHVPLEHGHVQFKVFGPRQHAGREIALGIAFCLFHIELTCL